VELFVLVSILSTSLILLAAGIQHLAANATFRSRLRAHGVAGPRAGQVIGAGLPVLEVLVAAATFAAVATANSTGLIAFLLVQAALYLAFAGYLARVVRAGNAGVPCGCGPAEVPVGRSAIARAIGLGLLSGASAAGVAALDAGAVALHADARGLLAAAAGLTFAILLVILASARRLEATEPRPDDLIGSA
jgi:hypothetical protein